MFGLLTGQIYKYACIALLAVTLALSISTGYLKWRLKSVKANLVECRIKGEDADERIRQSNEKFTELAKKHQELQDSLKATEVAQAKEKQEAYQRGLELANRKIRKDCAGALADGAVVGKQIGDRLNQKWGH